MTEPRGGWTDDRIALLRSHWDDGHSATQIALMIGSTSRNAVLGKAFRLGLPPRTPGTMTMTERARRAVESHNRERGTRTEYLRAYRAKHGARPGIPREPKLSDMLEDVPEPDPALSITLGEITNGRCLWIDGEPNAFEAVCCGNDIVPGQSWCPHHYLRVFNYQAGERVRNGRKPAMIHGHV